MNYKAVIGQPYFFLEYYRINGIKTAIELIKEMQRLNNKICIKSYIVYSLSNQTRSDVFVTGKIASVESFYVTERRRSESNELTHSVLLFNHQSLPDLRVHSPCQKNYVRGFLLSLVSRLIKEDFLANKDYLMSLKYAGDYVILFWGVCRRSIKMLILFDISYLTRKCLPCTKFVAISILCFFLFTLNIIFLCYTR